jgi:hypothetical protein
MDEERLPLDERIELHPEFEERLHDLIDIYEEAKKRDLDIKDLDQVIEGVFKMVRGTLDMRSSEVDLMSNIPDLENLDMGKIFKSMSKIDTSKMDPSQFDLSTVLEGLGLDPGAVGQVMGMKKDIKKEFESIYKDGLLDDLGFGINDLMGLGKTAETKEEEKQENPKAKKKKKKDDT